MTDEKSHVAMEHQVCLVCGTSTPTGNILLSTRIRNGNLARVLDQDQVTGWNLCPEHRRMHEADYVALVVVDPSRSSAMGYRIRPEDAHRTGELVHVRRAAWPKVFHTPPPDGPVAFIDQEVYGKIHGLVERQREIEGWKSDNAVGDELPDCQEIEEDETC